MIRTGDSVHAGCLVPAGCDEERIGAPVNLNRSERPVASIGDSILGENLNAFRGHSALTESAGSRAHLDSIDRVLNAIEAKGREKAAATTVPALGSNPPTVCPRR